MSRKAPNSQLLSWRFAALLSLATSACSTLESKSTDSGDETPSANPWGESGTSTTDTPEPTIESDHPSTDPTSADDPEPGQTFVQPSQQDPDVNCDLWSQDCPEGEKCTLTKPQEDGSWKGRICVPFLESPDQVGEPCEHESYLTGIDTCDLGAFCWLGATQREGEKEGVCWALCQGPLDDPACPEDSRCWSTRPDSTPLCVPNCNPVLQDCPLGALCSYAGSSYECISDQSKNEHPFGAACTQANQCNPGLACIPAINFPGCDSFACCTPFCDLEDPSLCDRLNDPTECVPFFERTRPPAGYEYVGFCQVLEKGSEGSASDSSESSDTGSGEGG